MSRRWLAMSGLALAAGFVIAGCGKPKEETTVVTPPAPAVAGKPTPTPGTPVEPTEPGAVIPQEKEHPSQPGAAVKPPAPTAAAPVAGDPWSQMRAARRPIRSMKVTMQQQAQKMVQVMKLEDGKPVRAKMTAGPNWVLVQLDQKKAYIYDAKGRIAIEASTDEEPFASMAKSDDLDMLQKDAVSVTSGKLDSLDCWIIETKGEQAAKFWIDKKQGLVQQVQKGNEKVRFKTEEINAVPDKEFELPKGTKTKTMAEMMKGMKGQPGMPALPK